MKTHCGNCPHCGEEVFFRITDNKLSICCQCCQKPVFSSIRPILIVMNLLLLLSLLPALFGMWLRSTLGPWGCFGLIAVSALCLFGVLAIERTLCSKQLKK